MGTNCGCLGEIFEFLAKLGLVVVLLVLLVAPVFVICEMSDNSQRYSSKMVLKMIE